MAMQGLVDQFLQNPSDIGDTPMDWDFLEGLDVPPAT